MQKKVMDLLPILRIKKDLSDNDVKTIAEIEEKIKFLFPSDEDALNYTLPPLDSLYEGQSNNPVEFINRVFLDFVTLRSKTEKHKKRIYDLLSKLNEKQDNIELVNIYRNVVSDLFDPYISLFVATIQFSQDKFISIQQANLAQSEFNKYEFVKSKISNSQILDGYNPIVRNAISHTGSEGIIYKDEEIVFRNIKRGTTPDIKFVKWSTSELEIQILKLLNFVHGIDCAIEIFGFDSSELIQSTEILSHKFIDEILTKEQRLIMHKGAEDSLSVLTNFKNFSHDDKIDILSKLFFIECKKRRMSINNVGFDQSKQTVVIEVPFENIDLTDENEIIGRAMKLLRYGIIGSTFYKFKYTSVLIKEKLTDEPNDISVLASITDLDEFGKENLGLYDLLYDSKLFIHGQRIDVEVDFDKLDELEYMSTDRVFPRKKRKRT